MRRNYFEVKGEASYRQHIALSNRKVAILWHLLYKTYEPFLGFFVCLFLASCGRADSLKLYCPFFFVFFGQSGCLLAPCTCWFEICFGYVCAEMSRCVLSSVLVIVCTPIKTVGTHADFPPNWLRCLKICKGVPH